MTEKILQSGDGGEGMQGGVGGCVFGVLAPAFGVELPLADVHFGEHVIGSEAVVLRVFGLDLVITLHNNRGRMGGGRGQ